MLGFDERYRGPDFSIGQRTTMLADWKSSYVGEKKFVQRLPVARVVITDLRKDLTIKIRKRLSGKYASTSRHYTPKANAGCLAANSYNLIILIISQLQAMNEACSKKYQTNV